MHVWRDLLRFEENANGKKQGVNSVCCIFFSFAHKDREGNFSKVIQQKQEWIEGQGGAGVGILCTGCKINK